jgi:hypothetical protein
MHTMSLSDRAILILAILREQQTWLTRAQIAHALGRRRLNQQDFVALGELSGSGQIEVRSVETSAPIGRREEYKAKEQ